MSSLNDCLKKISILEVLIILLILIGLSILLRFYGYSIGGDLIYLGLIVYFIYRLRFFGEGFKQDFNNIFSNISPKSLLTIVLVNVFFSYGMLYISIFAREYIPGLNSFLGMSILHALPINSLVGIGASLSIIFISPVCEELLFR